MANETVKILSEASFEQEVLKAQQPVLVDFWAPWCGPCRLVSPLIDQLAEEYAGRAVIGKINVDDEPELATTFDVSVIPTLVAMKDGGVLGKTQGVVTEDAIFALMGLK